MGELIKLLPDSIANQIAAGEVIQRPASVIKELLENAIDAGATDIRLIVKNAGKTFIQVVDNGSGMSDIDARMSFERHATSKIRTANDLFSIKTMGFRGEALASIAAIAQVEMKTNQNDDQLGIRLVIEGTAVKKQEPSQAAKGTSITVKNLFFNVPARRKFLKSDAVEMKHIIDEFQHIAFAHSDIAFSLHHNDNEVYHLPPANLRQRILGVIGRKQNEFLVPLEENSNYVNITGFIGKPKLGKKTRGDQYFFVNHRFIKSAYLNHAVKAAYEDIMAKELYPFYVIFLEIDPAKIDVNVHPTKEQIKFEDERLIYNYLRVAARHALGKYSIVPTIDFEHNNQAGGGGVRERPSHFDMNDASSFATAGNSGSPFKKTTSQQERDNIQNWEKVFENIDGFSIDNSQGERGQSGEIDSNGNEMSFGESQSQFSKPPYQIHDRFLVAQIKSGIMVVDQQAAHERILYEGYLNSLQAQHSMTQKVLFPSTVNLSPSDAELMNGVIPLLNQMGFEVENFGQDAYVVHGVPAHMSADEDPERIILQVLDQYKKEIHLPNNIEDKVAKSMATSTAMKRGTRLDATEMHIIIDTLFSCENPFKSPTGRNCFVSIELGELERRFQG